MSWFYVRLQGIVPFQALQAYGVAVDAVCPGKKAGDICRTVVQQRSIHQTYDDLRGHNFILNATFNEIEFENYYGLAIPGGRAPEYLSANQSVVNLVRKFCEAGKPMAVICHGLLIPAAGGLIKDKKCTAYRGIRQVVIDAGAAWVEPEWLGTCVVDGNFVTGTTYYGHPEYLRCFVKALGGTIMSSHKRVLFLCGVSFNF